MTHGGRSSGLRRPGVGLLVWLIIPFAVTCGGRPGPSLAQSDSTLRVGVGGLPQQSAQAGLRPLVANFSLEGLVNLNADGRPRPFLAESWKSSPDGLSLALTLHKGAKFHDGTNVTGQVVVGALEKLLPPLMGPAFDDVRRISAPDDDHVLIDFREPSEFFLEALDTALQKPGKNAVSTGPFIPASSGGPVTELRANHDYYLGRPAIERIALTTYPTVRAAWAELLRGNLDMLFEVNNDALDSLQGSSSVAVFSFIRHYQYIISFGAGSKGLESPQVRRELNAAIDRAALVQAGLRGNGVASTGPVPPQHWALDPSAPRLRFDADLAKNLAARHLSFTCLVPADSVYERVALSVKQQLAAANVDMRVKEVTQEQLLNETRSGNFEAVLVDPVSGPSMFRVYRQFYSKVKFEPKPRTSPLIDAALDRVRHARSDDEYRAGVTAFQQAVVDDPPALFLAWGGRARAVSRRFDVPAPESGRDVLATLRLWRPVPTQQVASRN